MSRQQVRSHKRALRRGAGDAAPAPDQDAARDSALALLVRSLRMGHVRLAMLRLRDAVDHGAPITPDQWRTCRQIAMASADLRCVAIYAQAWQASEGRAAARERLTPAAALCSDSSGPRDRTPASSSA